MAYQLWISDLTGYRRKGTRMSDLRKLFETGITVNSIQEPLKCCFYEDKADLVKSELNRLEFDIAGISASEGQPIVEFVQTKRLYNGTCLQAAEPIMVSDIISESTPLIDVLMGLKERDYFFIQNGMQISGIITKADIQKPPVRILIFGMISLLEMHISYFIREFFPNEKWIEKLSQNRVENAKNVLQKRKERNEEIDLTDCLQFADKKEIVCKSDEIKNRLGIKTKNEAMKILGSIEKIRDKLAHSQDLVSGIEWEQLIDDMQKVECLLKHSDDILDKESGCKF